MSNSHRQDLFSYIECYFPESFAVIKEKDLIAPHLFSPFTLEIPKIVKFSVENFVKEVYQIKESADYQKDLTTPENFGSWPKTPSLFTCFDFHYSESTGLKLIEINTNASLCLPSILQSCARKKEKAPPPLDEIYRIFKEAFDLNPKDPISIFDAIPEKEGLYFEFLIFKEWLQKLGHSVNIVSLENFKDLAHQNIYNRYTDFYFAEPRSVQQKNDYYDDHKKFSPNPREYFLLADKKRLNQLRAHLKEAGSSLFEVIPETRLFSEFASEEEIWANRKKYFFKPSASYGGKGAFSGKGISRKAFAKIFQPDFIAQELCPAGRRKFSWEDQEVEMKFDLRFFTFQGRVHNAAARLYQGQTTNMKTPHGGLTPIEFV